MSRKSLFYLFCILMFTCIFPALGFCTDYELSDVNVNVADAAQVAGAGLSGCAVMWGFRKAIKTINRC